MLRSTLLFGALLSVNVIFAQNQLSVFAGPQATTARYTLLGQKQDMKMKYGFQAGVQMKTLFEGQIFFAPAVFYSMKGYDVTFNGISDPPDVNATTNNTTIHTLELAALIQVDLSKSPSHAFIKAGPSLDFQLFGREKFDLNVNGGSVVERNMKFSYEEYGHYSANMLLQLGYETSSGFLIFAHATHGLASINNHDDGPKIRHRAFGISIGKTINRKKIVMDTRNKE